MKKAVAMKWVKALRSGKYKKGKSALRSGDKFCCLGVLCDISKQGKWDALGYYGGEKFSILPLHRSKNGPVCAHKEATLPRLNTALST